MANNIGTEEKPEVETLKSSNGLSSEIKPEEIKEPEGPVSVKKAEFQQLTEVEAKPGGNNISLLLDVKLPIAIELGKTVLSIQEILNLGPGSIVELDKLAGEPVDVLVNNKKIAQAEVVVVEENFGVRITNLVSPEERIKSL
jgi:flagellar motor switch protein FliN/FliY